MEDTRVHALDYLNVVRRRRWWLTVPILASIGVGALLVQFLPKEYTSSATLGVTAPVVSPDLVSQPIQLDNQERMRALSQQLVSPPILTRVVKEEGLAEGGNVEAVIARIRTAIKIGVPDPVAPTDEPRRLDTFFVSYADAEPTRAQRIANRIVNVFVDENSKTRTERAEDTSAFIGTQVTESQQRLAQLETALREAKEVHMGQLPEQTQANLQTLSGLRMQLEANATALRSEQDRLSIIERQLESMRQGSADVFVPRAGGDPVSMQPETRMLMLQRELAEARTAYTPKHPEVQRLEEELAIARRDAAAAKEPNADRQSQLVLDPAYRQLMGDQQVGQLRIRDLRRSETDIRRQIGVYQARVEGAPRVEQQLASVSRDYELEKQNYSRLSEKLQQATMNETLARNRRGEQFTVLYSASFPTQPTKPIPWRVMLISIVAGMCVGGASMFGREYLDRSVHDVRDIKDEFDVPVLGEVTRIQPV